jgi:hypothetical protein
MLQRLAGRKPQRRQERELGAEGQGKFGDTFRSLAGEPINWEDTL